MAPSTCATLPIPTATEYAILCVSPFPILAPAARSQTTGHWRFLGAPGATTLDSTGQYLPHGNALNAMALGGPVQGQLLGATTFTNSGIIDLQANPAAGDVLLVTGGHTAGTAGGGTFVANGGSLLLDTVLNDGAPSHSDVLVVDEVGVGAAGPTRISVRNAGGARRPDRRRRHSCRRGPEQWRDSECSARLQAWRAGRGRSLRIFSVPWRHGSGASDDWFLRSDLLCRRRHRRRTAAVTDAVTAGPPVPPPAPPAAANLPPGGFALHGDAGGGGDLWAPNHRHAA